MNDSRNVTDEFKGRSESEISVELDKRGAVTEVAIENTLRDFNMGSIVRSANAFGIRTVHVVGRRQWNKRGAMATDKYLSLVYHQTLDSLKGYAIENGLTLVAVDNVPEALSIVTAPKPETAILLFGQEGPGLSKEAIAACEYSVMIEQRGSTRSLNVGVAAGIVLHEWTRHLPELT